MLHTALWLLQQNVNQTWNSQRESYEVSVAKILENIDRVITAPHYTFSPTLARSSTFLAIDYALDEAAECGRIDIYGYAVLLFTCLGEIGMTQVGGLSIKPISVPDCDWLRNIICICLAIRC